MTKLYLILTIALLVSMINTVQAQTGVLSGRLQDGAGAPLPYANVAVLQTTDSALVTGTVTKEDGSFSIPAPAQGVYLLRLSTIGFVEKFSPAFSISSQNSSKDFGMIVLNEETETLEAVTVQALRPIIRQEADRMVVSIEGTALAAGNTAYDVLAKAPGVFIDQEGNIQLNGRSGVSIMLDGKLTYMSARDLRTLLEGMSAENIKNIEIITNPSAKYDAEGSSGILNINLKKNEARGLNGNVYLGYSYNGLQNGYSGGGTLNHKSGRWNSFLTLDAARRIGGREAVFTRIFTGNETPTYFDQTATGNFQVQGPPAVRLGSDYSLDERHSLGFMGYFATNKLETDFLTDTYIGPAPQQPELYIDANNIGENQHTNYTANLHYVGKFDTLGTQLTADLDWVKIRNRGTSDFFNYYYDLSLEQEPVQDFLYTETPNGFDIYSTKIDFTLPLSKARKIEMGAKASRVVSDNDSRFYFNNGEQPVLDISRTNHFIYDENIYAAYFNWNSTLGERFTLQAGLRAEQTVSKGSSLTTGEVTNRHYLDLFPSIFVQQKVSKDYQINYNYSRRIQRPNYGQLNPFLFYRDPYTWIQGNPLLRPQYTHALGITQTFKQNYSLVLNYQLNHDVIAELPAIIEETASTVYYTGNVKQSQNLSLTALLPVKILKFWDTNNTLLLSYNEFSAVVNQEQVLNSQLFYMLQSNHNLALPLGFKMEVNAAYLGPTVYALYRIEARWWLHLGIKKSFLDDTMDLSLNVNDMFKSQRLKIAAEVGEGNYSYFDQYFRNRSLNLSLRYRFSQGQKFEMRKRDNRLEELNRTGG